MADASDARPILYSVLSDVVPCDDRSAVLDNHGIHSSWSREASPEFCWFWVELFIDDPGLIRRMRRAYHEIGRAFADLERLHAHVYGTPQRVPQQIVEMIRRRVLTSWFPVSREVCELATRPTTMKTAADVTRLIGVEQWLREF